ncbi:MAG: energy-coupling factor transporter transmembrane protein EcfT [Treponema sp.]|nr:energy-coupling factor transporter transmembrane protein EcfT [Treponema sp.]
MKGFLDYIPGNSIFHRLNPIAKLVFAASICTCSFISSDYTILAGLLLLDIVVGLLSSIARRTFTLLKGLVKISIFLFVLQVLIIRSGNPIFTIPGINLPITDYGTSTAVRLVLRLSGATLPLALMLSVTKLADLSNSLVKNLHIPYKYAFTLTTAIRFIPVFAEEMAGIMEAQVSRGVKLDTKNPVKKLALILPLCAPLLVSSVRKTSASACAADLRGFKLRNATSSVKDYTLGILDCTFIFLSLALIAGTIYLTFLF